MTSQFYKKHSVHGAEALEDAAYEIEQAARQLVGTSPAADATMEKMTNHAQSLRAGAAAMRRMNGDATALDKEYAETPGYACKWKEGWPVPVRELWECDALSADRGMDGRRPSNEQDATLVSSRIDGKEGLHAPCFDIDFPARLVPSSTPGHSHLYFDVAVPWSVYRRLLTAMHEAGFLQDAFAIRSIERQQTMLIREGMTKQDMIDRGVKLLAASDVEVDSKGNRIDNEYNRVARAQARNAHEDRESIVNRRPFEF